MLNGKYQQVKIPEKTAARVLEAARAEYRRWGQISELIGSADGKRFLVAAVGGSDATTAPPLTVVVNWLGGLKK